MVCTAYTCFADSVRDYSVKYTKQKAHYNTRITETYFRRKASIFKLDKIRNGAMPREDHEVIGPKNWLKIFCSHFLPDVESHVLSMLLKFVMNYHIFEKKRKKTFRFKGPCLYQNLYHRHLMNPVTFISKTHS